MHRVSPLPHFSDVETHRANTFSRKVTQSINDPSAGSPTETLLRLLLPLSDLVYETSP